MSCIGTMSLTFKVAEESTLPWLEVVVLAEIEVPLDGYPGGNPCFK